MMTSEQLPFTTTFTRPDGSQGTIDGVPTYSVDPPSVAEVVNLAADGLSGAVSALAVGAGTLRCEADADLGEGIVPVVLTGDFAVTEELVSGGTITFGAPVPKNP